MKKKIIMGISWVTRLTSRSGTGLLLGLSVLAGFASLSTTSAQTITTVAGNGTLALAYGCCGDGGPATAAEFGQAHSIAFDHSGNLYIADGLGEIRVVNSSGIINLFAGQPGLGSGGDGGPATACYIEDAGTLTFDGAGNLYFVEVATQVVRKINTAGIVSRYAGVYSGGALLVDGAPATNSVLNGPVGLVVDPAGNLYISSYTNPQIYKVNTSGIISIIAGTGSYGYSGDNGPATAAKFNVLGALTLDGAGNIYVADQYNNAVRKINTSGIVTTIAGTGTGGFSGDGGPATAAELRAPYGLKFDAFGNLFISDQQNERIRVVNTAGIISTVAGCGIRGYSGDDGPATAAKFLAPGDLAFDASGNLYIADDSNSAVRKITPDISLSTGNVNATTADLRLFPNPNYGSFTLMGNLANGKYAVSVLDVLGRTLYSKNIMLDNAELNEQISLNANIPNGIYLVHINGEGENRVLRFVLEK